MMACAKWSGASTCNRDARESDATGDRKARADGEPMATFTRHLARAHSSHLEGHWPLTRENNSINAFRAVFHVNVKWFVPVFFAYTTLSHTLTYRASPMHAPHSP